MANSLKKYQFADTGLFSVILSPIHRNTGAVPVMNAYNILRFFAAEESLFFQGEAFFHTLERIIKVPFN